MEIKPCNPLQDLDCNGVDEALSQTIFDRFTRPSPFFDVFSPRGKYEFTPGGLKLSIEKRFDNPSIRSNFYILFGRLEFRAKASKGQGIISSVYLQSDDLDEIDIEWIGGLPNAVQTNYFVRGNVSDYLRGAIHGVPDAMNIFHDYVIDWTYEKLLFFIDGQLIREVHNDASVQDYGYPQTPMAVYIGSWVGGDPENLPGTIEWAGGLTDFSQGPFSMEIESILITDYSSGRSYRYAGKTGDIASIESIGGEVNGRVNEAEDEVLQVLQIKEEFTTEIEENELLVDTDEDLTTQEEEIDYDEEIDCDEEVVNDEEIDCDEVVNDENEKTSHYSNDIQHNETEQTEELAKEGKQLINENATYNENSFHNSDNSQQSEIKPQTGELSTEEEGVVDQDETVVDYENTSHNSNSTEHRGLEPQTLLEYEDRKFIQFSNATNISDVNLIKQNIGYKIQTKNVILIASIPTFVAMFNVLTH